MIPCALTVVVWLWALVVWRDPEVEYIWALFWMGVASGATLGIWLTALLVEISRHTW